MSAFWRNLTLYVWALLIAIMLWFQVHGQGESTLSMDVSLQLRGLASDMVLVNDLPDHVKVTISGLQARLKSLNEKELYISLSAQDIHTPGVVERSLSADALHLPPGLVVDKIQPDRLQLQVDRLGEKQVAVTADVFVASGWAAESISVTPSEVTLSGPEVWLESLLKLSTESVRPEPKPGPFELSAGVVIPTDKAVKLIHHNGDFLVRGYLRRDPKPVAASTTPLSRNEEHTP
jgi:YbbR domain-containing protein